MVDLARLTKDQLELIKEKMGVENLWSFSKIDTYNTCSWLYMLKYVQKIRVKGDSCYTHFGTISHDIIQGFYDKEHEYADMLDIFNKKVTEWRIKDDPKLRFPSENVEEGYIKNLQHYFAKVQTMPMKVINERAVLAVFKGLEKYVFQGYIDSEILLEDNKLIILDYKTSTISGFTGEKLLKKARQLMIYAQGIIQHGRMFNGKMTKFNVDQIVLRYDMMKYCNVTFVQKNGIEKTTKAERKAWVAHIANQLRKDFEEVAKQITLLEKEITKLEKKIKMKKTTPEEAEGYSVAIGEVEHQIEVAKESLYDQLELNELIEIAINENSLESLPQFVQDKYTITNCHIDIQLTQDILDEFVFELVKNLDEVTLKGKEKSTEEAFMRSRIENSDTFYCVNLCDLKDHCSFYAEYKEHSAMFLEKKDAPSDEELLALLGLG